MSEQRLIDANALLENIEEWHDNLGGTMNPSDWGVQNVLQSVMDYIIEAETVGTVPVWHGEWTLDLECSECHEMMLYNANEEPVRSRHCPHCGAKMDGGSNDD